MKVECKSNSEVIKLTISLPTGDALQLVHIWKKIIRMVLPADAAGRLNSIIDKETDFIGEEFEGSIEHDFVGETYSHAYQIARALMPVRGILHSIRGLIKSKE